MKDFIAPSSISFNFSNAGETFGGGGGGLNSAGNFHNVKIEIFTSCSCHNVGEIYQTWSDTCTCKVVVLRSFLMPSIEIITDIQLEEGAVHKEVKPEARVPLFPIFNILKLPVIFY